MAESGVHSSRARLHSGDRMGAREGRKPSVAGIFQCHISREMGADSRPLSLIRVSYFYINPESLPHSLVKLNLFRYKKGK